MCVLIQLRPLSPSYFVSPIVFNWNQIEVNMEDLVRFNFVGSCVALTALVMAQLRVYPRVHRKSRGAIVAQGRLRLNERIRAMGMKGIGGSRDEGNRWFERRGRIWSRP